MEEPNPRDMDKCLSPWEDEIVYANGTLNHFEHHISAVCLRRFLTGQDVHFAVFCSRATDLWFYVYDGGRQSKGTTKKQAMKELDKLLVKNGYELLSQEEWDRLVVLQ